jgi:hypothetical protein
MTINEIKKKMLSWQDFYGGDMMYQDEINQATTKKQLSEIMNEYFRYLEDLANDAQKDCEEFKKSLGL